jgi:pSer/pThr/pTyr-binding forkhead associated (FHA) protein
MAILVFASDEEIVFDLDKDTVVIGRKSDCDIMIDDKQISKHHARILKDATHYALEDMESMNGTFINGKRVKRALLRDGDRIKLADNAVLVYHKDEMQRTTKRIKPYKGA